MLLSHFEASPALLALPKFRGGVFALSKYLRKAAYPAATLGGLPVRLAF